MGIHNPDSHAKFPFTQIVLALIVLAPWAMMVWLSSRQLGLPLLSASIIWFFAEVCLATVIACAVFATVRCDRGILPRLWAGYLKHRSMPGQL